MKIITKASGKEEAFDRNKLRVSLERAGASKDIAEQITREVEKNILDGMTTKLIYRKARRLLKKVSGTVAGRFHLKSGIMELGPSGFPFEKYVSHILEEKGYKVQVGKIVEGKCVNHEVDVIAEKDDHHFMIECKYHNTPGMVCDVKIPLYIQARFQDVKAKWQQMSGHETKIHQGWVITNMRFTSDAATYGSCAGLRLVGLDFPQTGSLRQMIEETGLYPLTCLTSLTQQEKKLLLEKSIVLCHDVCSRPSLLKDMQIPENRIKKILEEGSQLCYKLVHHDHR